MADEMHRKTSELLTEHVDDFNEYKESISKYLERGTAAMHKIDELHTGHVQMSKYLANLSSLPIIADNLKDLRENILPTALDKTKVPVETMDAALRTQARVYTFVIRTLAGLVVSLFVVFLGIKYFYPEFFTNTVLQHIQPQQQNK